MRLQQKKEIEVLLKLDHQNIIKLYEIYEDTESIHLVTELCYGESLFNLVFESNNGISENKARNIMRQIVAALSHIHASNVVHRDLKPENILFSIED